MNNQIINALDEHALPNRRIDPNNYPTPEVSVDEGWQAMKELLAQTPPPQKPPVSVFWQGYAWMALAAAIVIGAIFLIGRLSSASQQDHQSVQYYAYRSNVRVDTLRNGWTVKLDQASALWETLEADSSVTLKLQGAAYLQPAARARATKVLIGTSELVAQQASFYVQFDSAKQQLAVYVVEGMAKLQLNHHITQLRAGESMVVDVAQSRILSNQRVSPLELSYATGILEFSNTPLSEVARVLEKHYRVTIIFEHDALRHCQLTTRFDQMELQEVLDVMTYTLNLQYLYDDKNKQVLLSGDGCN